MYEDSTYKLGQKVQDRISGFTGIVSTVGFHIAGCERIGVRHLGNVDDPPKTVSNEEFFFPSQLNRIEEYNYWTELDHLTEVDVELGEEVEDRGTGFNGRVHIINYNLFNCPQVLAYTGNSDGEVKSCWIDAPLIESKGAVLRVETGSTEQATGAASVDAKTENLSADY